MTPSTPPLVDVIAEALYRNEAEYPGEYIKPFNELPTRTRDAFAHQARAVLAAISEAGAVEVQFGLDFGDEVSQQDTLEDVHDERDTILGWIGDDEVQASDYGPLAPVTRTVLTHIGPWTAVEV